MGERLNGGPRGHSCAARKFALRKVGKYIEYAGIIPRRVTTLLLGELPGG